MRILLIEDDELIVESLAKALIDQHYTVDIATDGQTGWELAESFTYDLILLDVVLPKLNGILLCQRLRSSGNQTPILLLTAQDASTSKVMGLDAGADDYVAKPFNLQELLARIRALLRRGGSALPPLLEWRNLQLDPSTCEVSCNGQVLHLTPKEYGLLELFLRNNHRIFSCGALIDHLWSLEEPPTEETVRSHVKGLRQKLKAARIADDPIETVYGIGYRLKPAEPKTRESIKIQPPKLDAPEPVISAKGANSEGYDEATRIWQHTRENLDRRVTVVEQAIALLQQDRLSEEVRQQAEREAHRLAGSLGTFGSDEGSRLAQAIEPLLATGLVLEREQIQQLTQLTTHLRQELRALENAPIPELLAGDAPADERPCILIVHAGYPKENLLRNRAQAESLAAEAANWGLRSQRVATLAAARNQLSRQRPDAVLFDLPIQQKFGRTALHPDALALLAELSSYSPPIPVIVLSEQESLLDRVKIARLGGCRILHKPVSPAQALEAVTQVLQHTRTEETRVMIVDDDPHVLSAVHALLEPWGIKVFTLDNPLRFLDAIAIASPDLLVLDIEMPHVTGIELCQVVRNASQWSDLPILFLTVHNDAETMHRVFSAGADDYVGKPIVGPELVTRILNRLERSRWLKSLADTDALTGVANRRKSTYDLAQWLQASDLDRQPFCFAILALDQFKVINHRYGHAAGDQVLFRFGKLLQQTFHSEDSVGRWGGTEFVIGMAGMSKEDGAQRLSEVLNSLRQMDFAAQGEGSFRVTGSAAVVEYPHAGRDLQTLYRTAEAALSQAKTAGGDRVVSG